MYIYVRGRTTGRVLQYLLPSSYLTQVQTTTIVATLPCWWKVGAAGIVPRHPHPLFDNSHPLPLHKQDPAMMKPERHVDVPKRKCSPMEPVHPHEALCTASRLSHGNNHENNTSQQNSSPPQNLRCHCSQNTGGSHPTAVSHNKLRTLTLLTLSTQLQNSTRLSSGTPAPSRRHTFLAWLPKLAWKLRQRKPSRQTVLRSVIAESSKEFPHSAAVIVVVVVDRSAVAGRGAPRLLLSSISSASSLASIILRLSGPSR